MLGLSDWIYNYIYQQQGCLPANFYDLLSIYMDTEWTDLGSFSGGRQQIWQTCNEFGLLRSSDGDDHPFGDRFPYEIMFDQCNFILNYT